MAITAQSIIDHFSDPEADGYGKWLLYKGTNLSTVNKKIRCLCYALGTSNEAATLEVVRATWFKLKQRANPMGGFEIPGTTLRVYRALHEEGGSNYLGYIAFGQSRPELSVHETYFGGGVMPPKKWRGMAVVSGKRQRGHPLAALEESDRMFEEIEAEERRAVAG